MAHRCTSTASGRTPPITLARSEFTLGGAAAVPVVALEPARIMATTQAFTSASWTISTLGTPIHNVAANSAAFGTWPDGREIVDLVLNGSQAR